MKKTEGRKSRWTAPLKAIIKLSFCAKVGKHYAVGSTPRSQITWCEHDTAESSSRVWMTPRCQPRSQNEMLAGFDGNRNKHKLLQSGGSVGVD